MIFKKQTEYNFTVQNVHFDSEVYKKKFGIGI